MQMKCWHVKHKGEMWELDLGDERIEVRDAAENVRARFTRDEAAQQFLLPSFSESIKQLRVPVDGELWYFDLAKDDLKQLKAYINRAVVAAGPEAIGAVRNRAIRDALIGVAAAVIGIVLTAGSFLHAAQNPGGGEYVITYGVVLFGVIFIGKGVYGFLRYSHLRKLSQAPDGNATNG